jgi:hypothetical protein
MPDYITVADVREEMLDRAAEDHLVLADLAFTDEDIEWAMKKCARKFNSVKPLITSAEWDKLPLNSSVFFDGIAWALCRRWHLNVSMNDYDYSAGGVSANVQGSLLRNLEKLREKLEQEFVQYATDLKVAMNLEGAYGPIG